MQTINWFVLLGGALCLVSHVTVVNCLAEYSPAPNRLRRTVFSPKKHDTQRKHIVTSEEKAATNKSAQAGLRPRLNLSRHTLIPFDPFAFRCIDAREPQCANSTALFAQNVLAEFRRSLRNSCARDAAAAAAAAAAANSEQHGGGGCHGASPAAGKPGISPICLVMQAKVRTLRHTDGPFREHRVGAWLPRQRLLHPVLSGRGAKGRGQRSCVIVASAGSLSRSGLGEFIDQHDIVMRFNHAPVDGYEQDVGRKTTVRVVNSQVVTKPEFDFVHSPMFRDISVAAWDPGRINDSLSDWLAKPDFNLFDNYMSYRQKARSNTSQSDAHLIDPRSIWQLWRALQQFTADSPMQANPPSSGFIGIALLLPICAYVDVVEYVPSTRLNGRCHYYDADINPACTFGSWHPLAAEKLMAYAMNSADEFTTFQRGFVRIRRPRKNEC